MKALFGRWVPDGVAFLSVRPRPLRASQRSGVKPCGRRAPISGFALLTVACLALPRYEALAQIAGRSAFCHVTDGAFTTCPDGTQEWSDVTPQFFPESGSYLYVDQADLDSGLATADSPVDTLMLMYDECRQTSPLGPDQYVRVGFTTVEDEEDGEVLEHYVIHIFTDGTIVFKENGNVQATSAGEVRVPEIEGQRGRTGFGPSPRCPFDHVFAEFEIKLSVTGVALDGGYSPDPQFWSAEAPCNQKCQAARSAKINAGACLAGTAAAFSPCDGFCAGFATVTCIIAISLHIQADDPPDPNFMAIAEPVIPPFQSVTVANAGTQAAADAANALLANLSEVAALESALLTSNERAQGAAEAGDAFWRSEQMQAAAQFATELANRYEAQPMLLAASRSTLEAAGLPSVVVSPADVSALQADIMANGLPTLLTDALAETSLAGRADAVDALSTSILSVDPRDAAGSFPEMLTGSGLIGSVEGLATLRRAFARSVPGFVPPITPGLDANVLPANDDGSTGLVPIGFPVNFFGTTYDALFVNNNGNVTFDQPLAQFTPFDLASTARAIIAPFFADVDTRVGNVVTYGQGTVDGRRAFGVNWPGVGCFSLNTSVLNFFRLRLIDRSDVGAGDFDIVFGYDSIQWETGQASGGDAFCQGGSAPRVGYSNGTGLTGTFFELPGSGVPGAFLDSNLDTGLRHQGRLRFVVRSGMPVTAADGDADSVEDEVDNCPTTPNAGQADRDSDGIGDACAVAARHSTAAFITAAVGGDTLVEETPLGVSDAPSLLAKVIRIVRFRIDAGLTDSAQELTANLVRSLVEANLVPSEEADGLVSAVLEAVQSLPGDLDHDGDVDRDDLSLLLTDRNRSVGLSACGLSCDLDGDGTVTVLDGRKLVLLCTRAGCASE
jgi:hypothetical protein